MYVIVRGVLSLCVFVCELLCGEMYCVCCVGVYLRVLLNMSLCALFVVYCVTLYGVVLFVLFVCVGVFVVFYVFVRFGCNRVCGVVW